MAFLYTHVQVSFTKNPLQTDDLVIVFSKTGLLNTELWFLRHVKSGVNNASSSYLKVQVS